MVQGRRCTRGEIRAQHVVDGVGILVVLIAGGARGHHDVALAVRTDALDVDQGQEGTGITRVLVRQVQGLGFTGAHRRVLGIGQVDGKEPGVVGRTPVLHAHQFTCVGIERETVDVAVGQAARAQKVVIVTVAVAVGEMSRLEVLARGVEGNDEVVFAALSPSRAEAYQVLLNGS